MKKHLYKIPDNAEKHEKKNRTGIKMTKSVKESSEEMELLKRINKKLDLLLAVNHISVEE